MLNIPRAVQAVRVKSQLVNGTLPFKFPTPPV
jgi:hypothetical protein